MDPDKNDAAVYETLTRDAHRNPDEALVEMYRRLRPGDPPTVESARALFRGMFLDPRRYDLAPGGPLHAEQEARDGVAAQLEDAPDGGRRRGGPAAPGGQAGALPDGRHRPPREPARAVGRGASGEPVPRGPDPHGAGDQGANVHRRHREPDAARPGERQAGLGGRQGVLRLLAALPVHGPDEPAGRADAQAAAFGPRAAGPLAGASGLRGAGRPPDALRPDLPHRDAGRPEHRADLVALDVRADQRVRVHRDAVPARSRPAPSRTTSSS